jgi:8-oxo-dGTP diphosphatase/2-hydroxy-dATP diphosphatase
MKKIQTLCMIYNQREILLGMKLRDFGKGRWNGFGGKVKQGETPEAAAIREVKEEIGVEVEGLKFRGMLNFSFIKTGVKIECHLYSAERFLGVPMETDEMRPRWFDLGKIPYDKMWPDDIYWLPEILAGKNLNCEFNFTDGDKLVDHKIKEI